MSETCNIVCIDPSKVKIVLPHVHAMLESAYRKSDEAVPGLEHFESGHILLWIAWGAEQQVLAAMTTSLVRLTPGLACKISALGGGEMNRWLPHLAQIEEYAKREGCYRMLIEGRPGWERALPDYDRVAVVLEKRI